MANSAYLVVTLAAVTAIAVSADASPGEKTNRAPVFAKDIKITLQGPDAPTKMDAKLDLDLAVTNTGRHAVRILNPKCSAIYPDAAHLSISAENGFPVKQVSHTMLTIFQIQGEQLRGAFKSETTELEPKATVHFPCSLVDAPREKGINDWSFQYHDRIWGQTLPFGNYKIRARYEVGPATAQQVLFASENPVPKYGTIWEGKSYSNEIELTSHP
jgi:hypothetical protein